MLAIEAAISVLSFSVIDAVVGTAAGVVIQQPIRQVAWSSWRFFGDNSACSCYQSIGRASRSLPLAPCVR